MRFAARLKGLNGLLRKLTRLAGEGNRRREVSR